MWQMKEDLVLAIRQVEDKFGSFLLLLSDFHRCACTIAKLECIFKLLSATCGSLEAFCFTSLLHGRQACLEHGNCHFVHSAESNVIWQTEKLTESSVLLVHCKYTFGK